MTVPYLARAATRQSIAWIGGSVHHVVLDGEATDGRLAASRATMYAGTASPVHVHDREDETVFVLQGTGVVWAGADRWEVGPGDTAFLPRGVPHTYVVTSEQAELLTICHPAGMEEFFRAAGWDLKDPKPEDWAVDLGKLAEVGESLGQHVLGPPLAPGDEMPREYLRP